MLIRQGLRRILFGTTLALLLSTRAIALFHFVDIVDIYSNADGTIQFIEMKMTSNSQNFLQGETFTSNAEMITFASDLSSTATLNKNWLMATSGFAALPGAVTPDYIIPDNFFSISGDTLTLVNGFNADSSVTFELNDLPIDGVLSMNASGATAPNSPTNFAGQTGSVLVPTNVFVDFAAGSGGFGTEVLPFGTLQEALNVVKPPATINLEPGFYDETFSGAFAISDALTLINTGGGSVIIGAPPARTENRSGFRSKPIASTSTRSGAP